MHDLDNILLGGMPGGMPGGMNPAAMQQATAESGVMMPCATGTQAHRHKGTQAHRHTGTPQQAMMPCTTNMKLNEQKGQDRQGQGKDRAGEDWKQLVWSSHVRSA